ncbi:ABC transporter ATP-binding protein [Enterovibrio sp. ZSDZ35]|uniref:ABC transporter ATP-binding protein n=1 Tax=Enterovibrio qingdaonensis TaxID=2899818 RepID=A0ABT5QPW0_9GAMM|nr:ABC transporter ATP-binding protein [Enterovibrio sp. ZSDZ35]MDD1782639.1 ABC transporter ATP-binding protein [Enterovibrio sp. ZSDZ35]
MTDKVLEINGLNVSFDSTLGSKHAVKDVSFDIVRGETLAVIGESGSGKSVTSKAILQILGKTGHIDSGEIMLHVDGSKVDITTLKSDSIEMRRIRAERISLVSQEPMSALSPVHTVGDQIKETLFLCNKGLTKEQAHQETIKLLGQVLLPDPETLIDKYPYALSGGQRQRVCIAMAIASRPDILIADEPTTALDVTTQAEILELFAKLQREINMSILFITHDLGVVAQISDRVVVMKDGEVVERGDVRQIFENPQHPYTIRLMDATKRLEMRSALKVPYDAEKATCKKPIIDARNVYKIFENGGGFFKKGKELVALEDVSVVVNQGESLGIVGESGSGKSTLGRAILGLGHATSGSILYHDPSRDLDVDLVNLERKQKDHLFVDLRLIFQDPMSSLNPRMTVADIILEPLRQLRPDLTEDERRKELHEVMDWVGVHRDWAARYPHAFSGGQRQRIVIARALITRPKLVIADEATAALDVSLRSRALDLLIEYQNRYGTSFILITHDIATVKYFCDRMVVLEKGKIVEQGTVDQIINNPQEAYTKRLIDAVPKAELPPLTTQPELLTA